MRGHNRIAVQNVLVLDHLRRAPLTPREALDKYHCFRLGARVWDLRQDGHEILTTRVTNEYGNPYAEYHLLKLAPGYAKAHS